jgi:type IV pilus assembly protein PilW
MIATLPASVRSRNPSRGFSIVELMVSVVIGMLAIMFATRMITGGEQTRQAALGGSDSMQNGMLAMFAISNDAKQAGYGLNDPLLVGCDTIFSDENGFKLASALRGTGTATPLAAAVIKNNGTAPDVISLYSGNSPTGTGSVRLLADYTGGTTASIDRTPFGFSNNDVIVVAPELPGSAKCALAQVSAASGIGATAPFLTFADGADQRFNTGELGAQYRLNAARIFNLGPSAKLSFHTWSVAAGGFLQLRSTDMAGSSETPAVIADNIVSIKAQYGFDIRTRLEFTPEKGIKVGQWSADMIDADDDGVKGSAGDYQHLAALRLAVIARSKAPERAGPTGTCTATPTAKVIFAAEVPAGVTAVPVTPNLAVSGDTIDWKCYTYRVFETIIPIRNTAWRPSAW